MEQSAQPSAPERAPGPVRRQPQPAQRSGNRFLYVLSLAAIALAFFIILASGAVLVYFYLSVKQTPLPTIPIVQPVDAPATRAAERVALVGREWPWRTVTLDAGFKTWVVPPEQIGVQLNVEATAAQPVELSQSVSAASLLIASDGRAFTPVWTFDRAAAEATLQSLSDEIAIPAENAGVRIVGTRLEATDAKIGRALDVTSTLAGLARNPWAIIQDGRLPLVIVDVEPAVGDAAAAVAKAEPWLQAPVTIQLYDALQDEKLTWTLQPEVMVDWLTIAPQPDAPATLDCYVEQDEAQAYLETQIAGLGAERYVDAEALAPAVVTALTGSERVLKARIYHREKRHTVAAGETLSSIAVEYGMPYPWIERANPDLGEFLRAGQVITIPSADDLAPLEPIQNKRIVVSLSRQRVWAYENGALKWEWTASTGMESSPTSPGIFQIQSHEETAYASNWNLWMPYFMGVYQPVPGDDFMNGFHGFPSRDDRQILWQGNLGRPVTYGCILVSTDNAKLLYDWAEVGVMVEIRQQ